MSFYVQTQVRYLFITPRSSTGSEKISFGNQAWLFFYSLKGLVLSGVSSVESLWRAINLY